MVEVINEKTPCGGAYAKIFYCDSKGAPTTPDKACQILIHEYSEEGRLLQETIAFANGWYPGKEDTTND